MQTGATGAVEVGDNIIYVMTIIIAAVYLNK
jgi:hypothetical protein